MKPPPPPLPTGIFIRPMVNMYLDDERPAPEGWVLVKTVEEAKVLLLQGVVREASLDHDLGACPDCMGDRTAEDWLARTKYTQMPHCEHVGTGYTLVCWMEETGHWPKERPAVHSANPAGRAKMQAAINREWVGQYSRRNDLNALAGTWNSEQKSEFERDTAPLSGIDPALWK